MGGPSLSHILAPSHPLSKPAYPPNSPFEGTDVAANVAGASAVAAEKRAATLPMLGPLGTQQPSPLSTHADGTLDSSSVLSSDASLQSPAVGSPTGHNRSGKLYACHDCGRSYSRPEHLVRHVNTHTLGRRFSCEICQKTFARKDLLRRHVANHENDSPAKRRRLASVPGASAAAARVFQACRSCAVARVKCDDTKPCRRCTSRKLDCVFSESGSSNAAMHLVQISANAHSSAAATLSNSSPDTSSPKSHVDQIQTLAVGSSDPWTPPSRGEFRGPSAPSEPQESKGDSPGAVLGQASYVGQPSSILGPGSGPGIELPPFGPSGGIIDVDTAAFHGFLRDILYEHSVGPTKPMESHGLAVLDFCDNANMDMTDLDFGLLGNWNLEELSEMTVPVVPEISLKTGPPDEIATMRQSLVRVWTNSPWQWDPNTQDSGYREHGNLPLPSADATNAQLKASGYHLKRVVKEKLEQPARDQVFAIVLSTCRHNANLERVSASFPTVDVLDTFVHVFLASHACQLSGWIHFPTFSLNAQWPEWVAIAAAAGATLMPLPALRKFGFALQEAVRISLPERFENKNTAIQDSGLVQSLVLVQDIALWSGNRRKMEIAECHLQIPVTMMRYRRKFQRSSYNVMAVDAADEADVLEDKWRKWVEREHWKRLVFHCYIRDSQTSMTTLTNTSISYSELTLPLPEAKELWLAESAKEWKDQYLRLNVGQHKRGPSIGDLFHDMRLLVLNKTRVDVRFSIFIFLHGFWTLILEYRQLGAVHRWRSYMDDDGGSTTKLLLSSRHRELVKDLQTFQSLAAELPDMTAQEHIILNLLTLNLYVSLDDLQLFAGKEGEAQARRIYPVLQRWVASIDSRAATWCAGQILRYAKLFPEGHLRDFYAVAVHHASLALWTYGVVMRAARSWSLPAHLGHDPVYLDGGVAESVHKFIGFGQGRPLVRGPSNRGGTIEASVEDPRACMEVAEAILRKNCSRGPEPLPSMAENLCHLIKQLGQAAWAVGLG